MSQMIKLAAQILYLSRRARGLQELWHSVPPFRLFIAQSEREHKKKRARQSPPIPRHQPTGDAARTDWVAILMSAPKKPRAYAIRRVQGTRSFTSYGVVEAVAGRYRLQTQTCRHALDFRGAQTPKSRVAMRGQRPARGLLRTARRTKIRDS